MHKLLIKIHKVTGLKYLCYTKKKDHISYRGSGTRWKKHLKQHGYEFDTILLYQTNDYDDFKNYATQKSLEYNVVESDEWANLKLEEGDGGDTVSKKRWITDGSTDKYMNISEDLPHGWKYGRSICVFNDSEKQKEFNSKSDRNKAGISIKLAWDEGRFNRDHSKCGSKGDNNVAKRPEVKEKIRQAALRDSAIRSERAKKVKFWEYSSRGHTTHNEN